jgi:hypothetical protein
VKPNVNDWMKQKSWWKIVFVDKKFWIDYLKIIRIFESFLMIIYLSESMIKKITS